MIRINALILILAGITPVHAGVFSRIFVPHHDLSVLNRKLHGRVLDFTANGRHDCRVWSPALGEKRDMYVYVPPGYTAARAYPFLMFLHGIGHDERNFMDVIAYFDQAIANGAMPPSVIVCPDGSVAGRPSILRGGSFFVNTLAGRFEDYIMQDVWNFAHENFSLRPEREAKALVGGSMGGFGAFNLGIKYRDRVSVIGTIFPPVDLLYQDCRGRYFANFDPNCMGGRTKVNRWAPIGRYGVVLIRQGRLLNPLFGRDADAIPRIRSENPVDMLESYDLQPGELQMFIAYVGRDEFNIDAQVESFVYKARLRGLEVETLLDPRGHHSLTSAQKLAPALASWVGEKLKDFGPCEIGAVPGP